MSRKAHLVQILIVDHDQLGADEITDVLENTRFPNDCICPHVLKTETVDIGEWSDDHPLNFTDKQVVEVNRLFGTNFSET